MASRRDGTAMKTFGELVPDDVSKVAEIPLSAVRLLRIDDFWDGPLSGIAEWEGRRLRFEMTDRSKLVTRTRTVTASIG